MCPLPSNDTIARIPSPSLSSPVILPGFLVHPPINSIQEDYPLWEIPFWMTIQGSHPSKFINIFILAYIIIILLVHSGGTTTEICEIKSEKILGHMRHRIQLILPNMALNREELSPQYLIFIQGQSKHCQLTAQVNQIDCDFLFGNARLALLMLRFTPQ